MENRRVKWGILGTGRIAHTFAQALQVVTNSELIAVGSRNKEKATQFASEFKILKAYGSYEELIGDPEVDVVYIATPHNLHEANTILALNHHKHVLCEKPMGVNRKESLRMMEKAKAENLFLMEALWSRFLPNIIKAKELVDAGEIGEVKLLTAFFSIRSVNGPEHRHFNIDLCGGAILDIGIYNIFLSLFLLGKPKSFTAMAGLSEQGGDNSSSYTFKYDKDVLAVMYSSFMGEAPIVAEIIGTKGKLTLEHVWFAPGNIKATYLDGSEKIYSFDIKGNGYEYEAEEAAACILAGKTQSELWSWTDSLQLMEMMDAIRAQCGIVYPKHDL
ncbi:Gfo/Idh/MocA family protein [Microbacter margulisiae]|uniref:Putative dehydrogenase n=1 Tax=Microbacter margulisiae TaxID=1350067 RepID=A0A7W5H3G4_9PORP|nr:Gfo/Idh/MocA family oxidoreductase [Microbacter margulisiae]MBB3188451.1 putative dehydrogenase [Microbacter margulisiae]